MKISRLTTEYLHVYVETDIDPRSGTVQFAFMQDDSEPAVSDWTSGSWDSSVASSPYKARCLVGTGGKTLNVGNYKVWVKISDSPEIPVRKLKELLTVF